MSRPSKTSPRPKKGHAKPVKKRDYSKAEGMADGITFRHPKANKRTQTQIAADLLLIERWHLRGKTEHQIVELLNEQRPYSLSRSQIHADLTKLQSYWKLEVASEIEYAKAKELKGMLSQEDELWEAWEKSKKDAVTETTHEKAAYDGKEKSKAIKKEGQVGDAAYMRLLLDIRERRAKLLGLDAPARTELSGPLGGPVQTQDLTAELAGLNKEDLRGIISACGNGETKSPLSLSDRTKKSSS